MPNANKLMIIIAAATLLSQPVAAKKAWRLLPGSEEDFRYQPALALLYGQLSHQEISAQGKTLWGIEAAFACPLVQAPKNNLRQQLSFVRHHASERTFQSLEANLHYLWPLAKNLKAGVGPGIGFTHTQTPRKNARRFGLQLGGSLHLPLKTLFFGAEFRYQFMLANNPARVLSDTATDWRLLVKVGMNFN